MVIGSDFYDKYQNGYDDVDSVVSDWKDVFSDVCVNEFSIDRNSANILFDDMQMDNWSHFHQTDDERNYGSSKWFEEFVLDCFYCCDRWSIDRLMRVHWRFLQWIKAVNKKEIESCLF